MSSTSFIHGFHAITARLRLDAKSVHELYCDSARADPRMRAYFPKISQLASLTSIAGEIVMSQHR